jgi:Arc/MetJ family transcription regulator
MFDAYTTMCESHTQRCAVRTTIDIDDRLLRQAMRSSGARTKRAVVDAALRLLILTTGQNSIRRLRGKVGWQGDLNSSRLESAISQDTRHR